jgi:flagellar hook-basal body complex protein FliE
MIPAITSVLSAVDPGSALDIVSKGSAAASGTASTDFGQMLTQFASDAVSTLKKGEATAISGIQGKASVQQVVEAVMNAQESLQTAIAIRDKLVSAYQEVSRMAI